MHLISISGLLNRYCLSLQIIILIFILVFQVSITNAADSIKNNELLNAATMDDMEKVQKLLDEGASPNACMPNTSFSALMSSARFPDGDMALLLLNKGANVNAKTNTGETALLYAVMTNNDKVATLLLLHGADIHAKSSFGMSPLSFAKSIRNHKMVRILTSSSAEAPPTHYKIKNKTSLLLLTDENVSLAKAEAPELHKIDDWNLRLAYFLGTKDYGFFSRAASQRIQLITPYSLTRYIYYKEGREYKEPSSSDINDIRNFSNIAWIWIWSHGTLDNIVHNTPAPLVKNVVIKIGDSIYQPYPPENSIPDSLSSLPIPSYRLFAFPIDLFSVNNLPLEIILIDSEGNRKPYKVDRDKIAKWK